LCCQGLSGNGRLCLEVTCAPAKRPVGMGLRRARVTEEVSTVVSVTLALSTPDFQACRCAPWGTPRAGGGAAGPCQSRMPKGPEWLPSGWLPWRGARGRRGGCEDGVRGGGVVGAYLPAAATECTVSVVPASVPLTTARLPARRFRVASAVLSVVARV